MALDIKKNFKTFVEIVMYSDISHFMCNKKEEMLEVVDKNGNVLSVCARKVVHSDKSLLHRTVHCIIINNSNHVLLQKRSMNKDIQPGKWDTSVGGHVDPGETIEDAVKRETFEELGIKDVTFNHIYQYIMESDVETELVDTYMIRYKGPFSYSRDEIEAISFFSADEIAKDSNSGIFTPNFLDEWRRFQKIMLTGGKNDS